MTREEAFTILGLSSDSGEEQIKKRYADNYNDYQIRLTQAPTPNLKKLYQKNLQELNDAMEILIQGSSSGMNRDLPGSAPVFDQTMGSSGMPIPPPAPTIKRDTLKNNTKAAESNSKFKNWFRITLILGVLFLSAAALTTIQWLDAKKQVSALTTQASAMQASINSVNSELEFYKKNFDNGIFKIKNYGSSPLTVKWLIVTYKDSKGNLVKFSNSFNTVINPGSEKKFEHVEGIETVWDGSVCSYTCAFEYEGGTNYYSGLWSQENKDGYLKLSL